MPRETSKTIGMLGFILLTAVALLQAPSSETKVLSHGLAEFLRRMGIPLRNHLTSDVSNVVDRQYDNTRKSLLRSDVPEHSYGVITTKVNKAFYLADAHCDPRPTAVRIPAKSPAMHTYPDHVILWRCTGSCLFTQTVRHCSVTRQDEIIVEVTEIVGDYYYEYYVTMYNHTECGCDCILKEGDCDPAKQVWKGDICRCLCISDEKGCDPEHQTWDKDSCQCKCVHAEETCKDHNKAWNFEKCGCHCRQVLKDKCASQGKNTDPQNCHCI